MASKRVLDLEKMASNLVGDGKAPNIFFVSIGGNIVMITLDFDAAYEFWKQNSNQRQHETALEDRKTGVLATVEPESDEPGAKLVRFDDTNQRL